MDKASWDKVKWRLIGSHLGYSKEELALFKASPRNEAVLDAGRALQDKRIVIEVVESHGCNSKHRVGDTFIFDGAAPAASTSASSAAAGARSSSN